jgi:hypothetical protein
MPDAVRATQEPETETAVAAASAAGPPFALPGGDLRLARRLDPTARAALLRGIQRTHGNGSVKRALLQRQTLKLRNGHELGVASSAAAAANLRSEAEQALKRLLDLWAIDVPTFDTTIKTTWARYGPADVITGADLAPLTAAITRNENRTLANEVANNFLYLSLPGGRGVGEGMQNDPGDVKAVQNALIAHGLLAGSNGSGTMDDATKDAIKALKTSVAAGTFGLAARRPNERRDGGDPFAGGTYSVTGDPVTFTPRGQAERTQPKPLAVYVPRSAPADRNDVHVFFTPYSNPMAFVEEQGLRAEEEGSRFILIAVPGLPEDASPNWVTITTSDIRACLTAVRRSSTEIGAIRLSAHSRGHRGLERSLGLKGTATLDLAKVERVTVFDASYRDLGTALTSHLKDLTAMQQPGKPGQFRAGAVNLYDVTVANISGLPGRSLGSSAMRALAYVRFVAEAIERGDIAASSLSTLRADAKKDVQSATRRLIGKLPPRGMFSTRKPTPAGHTDLPGWLAANAADLKLVDDTTDGLDDFVASQGLDMGTRMSRDLTAHHWLVAELAHESVD